MPRPAKFDEEKILAAAAKLVASGGPAAATMTAVRGVLGASSSSFYHRFRSRDELLGRLWLTKAKVFQDSWAAALEVEGSLDAGLEAALSLPRVVRSDPDGARIMLLHGRRDFLNEGWPPEMKAEAERLGRQVKEALTAMTKRLFGRDTAGARRATSFATLDIPYSAVRRFVSEGTPPPAHVDKLIACAYRAVVEEQRALND